MFFYLFEVEIPIYMSIGRIHLFQNIHDHNLHSLRYIFARLKMFKGSCYSDNRGNLKKPFNPDVL